MSTDEPPTEAQRYRDGYQYVWPFVVIVILAFLVAAYLSVGPMTTEDKWNPARRDVIVWTMSKGGDTAEFLGRFVQMRIDDKRLRVEGPCFSACTYFLMVLSHDQVCAGDNAFFGFHGVYDGADNFKEAWSKFYTAMYPKRVRDLLTAQGFDGSKDVDLEQHPTGFIFLTRDELGLQHCPE